MGWEGEELLTLLVHRAALPHVSAVEPCASELAQNKGPSLSGPSG